MEKVIIRKADLKALLFSRMYDVWTHLFLLYKVRLLNCLVDDKIFLCYYNYGEKK